MSGIIGSKLNIRGSGRVAKLGTDGQVLTSAGAGQPCAFEDAAGGGLDWQTIETGPTMSAVAGNGYWIDTTSNACTITLPASASNGDEIMFVDYARNWGTNNVTLSLNSLKFQAGIIDPEYITDGQVVHIVYSGATNGWMPIDDDASANAPSTTNPTGIFGGGTTGSLVGMTNLVSNAGVVATDTAAVMTAKSYLAACEYGNNLGIFGFGNDGSATAVTNLVTGNGVVASDQAAVTGTARNQLGAATYGGDKGIFGFGLGYTGITNLVSNTGVVAADVAAVGTARGYVAACEFAADKDTCIFGFGHDGGNSAVTNLVSNTGVVASDTAGVGTARHALAACGFGGDQGIFGFGVNGGYSGITNLVSNAGVVASDTAAVGTARHSLAATQYDVDKGIFGFGNTGSVSSLTNLVSNTGVVATDTAGVGTARHSLAACSYGN